MQATPRSAPISWNRFVRWSRRGRRSSSRPAACRCCCLRASARSSSMARSCSTASRWWQRPRRWRLRYAASLARWSAAAALTPRHRRHACRSTWQGAGESVRHRDIDERGTLVGTWARRDAGNPIILHPLVPPYVDRNHGPPRSPRESLRETQIGRGLLEAGELDLEWAGRGRTRRCIGNEDAGPCPLHAPRLGHANVPYRQNRFAELIGAGLHRAEYDEATRQQNRWVRATHVMGLLAITTSAPSSRSWI